MVFLFRRMEAGSPKPPGKATKRSKSSGVAQGLRKHRKSYQNKNDRHHKNILYIHASVTGLEVLKIAGKKKKV